MTPRAPSSSADTPLAGRVIMVTRSAEQSHALAAPLEALGATVVACPVIAIVDPLDWTPADEAIANLESYDWVVLTSTNAVDRFVARLEALGRKVKDLATRKIAVVGASTAVRAEALGLSVDLVPEEFRGEGLIDAFKSLGAGPDLRVLIPRALDAREILPETLREMGATVDVVPVYRTVGAHPDAKLARRLRDGGVDVVTFTSPSTFRHWSSAVKSAGLDIDEVLEGIATASIGPVTTAALTARGYEADIEAAESTIEGLVDAIVEYYRGRGRKPR